MTITAKFASICTACKGTITPGTVIDWTRGVGSRHVNAADCAAARQAPVAAKPVVDLSSVVAFLAGARDKGLKAPRTRFAAPGSGELQLSLAPLSGKNPGAVYVKVNGDYAGKVMADGAVVGITPVLVDALRAIAADPAAAGAAYGRLTGRCSFCTQGLTDEGSLEVGYGPVCAKNYGLPHKPRGSAKVTPVIAVAPVATPAPVVAPAPAQPLTPLVAALAATKGNEAPWLQAGWNDWKALGHTLAALKAPAVKAEAKVVADCDWTL
jgi:hypothetical protein